MFKTSVIPSMAVCRFLHCSPCMTHNTHMRRQRMPCIAQAATYDIYTGCGLIWAVQTCTSCWLSPQMHRRVQAVAWLKLKVACVCSALRSSGGTFQSMDDQALTAYAAGRPQLGELQIV